MVIENYSLSIHVTNVVKTAKIILKIVQNPLRTCIKSRNLNLYVRCLQAALHDYLQGSSHKKLYSIEELERDLKTLLTCTKKILPLLTQEAQNILSECLEC